MVVLILKQEVHSSQAGRNERRVEDEEGKSVWTSRDASDERKRMKLRGVKVREERKE